MKAEFTHGKVLGVVGILGALGVLGGMTQRGYGKGRTYAAPDIPRDEALEAKMARNRDAAEQERLQEAAEKRARKAAKKGQL